MEAIKQIVRIPENHEVRLKIPENIPANELAEIIIIINKGSGGFNKKIRELKEAMKDDLFRDDLKEISENFKAVDLEGWE